MTRQLRLVVPDRSGDSAGPVGADTLHDDLGRTAGVRLEERLDALRPRGRRPRIAADRCDLEAVAGRRLEVGTARRLFLEMTAGRGVVCVLAGEPSLRLETSWDGVFYADVPAARPDLDDALGRLGLQVSESPAEEEPEEEPKPLPAAVLSFYEGGADSLVRAL